MHDIRIQLSKEKSWRYFQYNIVKTFQKVRFMTLVVHRQAGKTMFGVFLLASFVLTYNKRTNPRAVVVMKTAAQAFGTYFTRMNDILEKLPPSIYIKKTSQTGVTTATIKRPWFKDYVTVTFAGSGNKNALRGFTNDLVIIDEAAFVDGDIWHSVLKESLDDTEGKALISSTQYGRTWFYKLQKAFNKMNEDGHDFVANIDLDNIDAQLRSDEYIEEKEILAKYSNKWIEYLREQKNDPDAVDIEESPFARETCA